MSQFDRLLDAETPLKFFIRFYELNFGLPFILGKPTVRLISREGKQALEVEILQTTAGARSDGSTLYFPKKTHNFTLTEDSELVLHITGIEPIVGLDNIKAFLRQFETSTSATSPTNFLAGKSHSEDLLPPRDNA